MALMKIFVRGENNYDMDDASLENGLKCLDPGRTLQSHAEDADINVLVRRFGVTGTVNISKRVPSYADYPEDFNFRDSLETIMQGEEAFAQVPAEIRARFHHNAAAFVEFCSKEENLPELRRLGLADIVAEPVEVPPTRVVIVGDKPDGKP